MLNSVWMYLLLASAVGFLLMGFDKLSAKVGSERVPELLFLLISLVGGFGGIILGILVFHHKISKRSFQLKIGVGAAISIMIFLLVVGR